MSVTHRLTAAEVSLGAGGLVDCPHCQGTGIVDQFGFHQRLAAALGRAGVDVDAPSPDDFPPTPCWPCKRAGRVSAAVGDTYERSCATAKERMHAKLIEMAHRFEEDLTDDELARIRRELGVPEDQVFARTPVGPLAGRRHV